MNYFKFQDRKVITEIIQIQLTLIISNMDISKYILVSKKVPILSTFQLLSKITNILNYIFWNQIHVINLRYQ